MMSNCAVFVVWLMNQNSTFSSLAGWHTRCGQKSMGGSVCLSLNTQYLICIFCITGLFKDKEGKAKGLIIWLAVIWTLWLERNEEVFNSNKSDVLRLLVQLKPDLGAGLALLQMAWCFFLNGVLAPWSVTSNVLLNCNCSIGYGCTNWAVLVLSHINTYIFFARLKKKEGNLESKLSQQKKKNLTIVFPETHG